VAKITKQALKDHEKALAILEKDELNCYEREFVLYHWLSMAGRVTASRAFFTPMHICDIVHVNGFSSGTIVDLGAGTGRLAHALYTDPGYPGGINPDIHVVCVETNPDFIDVGKKCVPWATWLQGNIYDLNFWSAHDLEIDWFVTNPPFSGSFGDADTSWLDTRSSGTALAAIEVGLRVADMRSGVGIVPQNECLFTYSGDTWRTNNLGNRVKQGYAEKRVMARQLRSFCDRFPRLEWGCTSWDTTVTDNDSGFEDAGVVVEVVRFDGSRCRDVGMPTVQRRML